MNQYVALTPSDDWFVVFDDTQGARHPKVARVVAFGATPQGTVLPLVPDGGGVLRCPERACSIVHLSQLSEAEREASLSRSVKL
jgi:hypothetical protein